MALFDGVRRMVGLTTEEDRARARDRMTEISASKEPAARFAAAFAEDLTKRDIVDPSAVRRAIPGIGRLSADVVIRRTQIAEALVETGERFVKHGSDNGLGRELGQALRESSLSYFADDRQLRRKPLEISSSPGYMKSQQGFLMDAVSETHAYQSKTVDRFLEASSSSEKGLQSAAFMMNGPSYEWDRARMFNAAGLAMPDLAKPSADEMIEVARTVQAKARAGILPAADVVELATMRTVSNGLMINEKDFPADRERRRIVPDFDRGRHAVRNPLLKRELIESFHTTREKPIPLAVLDPKPRPSRGPRDEVSDISRPAAVAAALSASRSRGD